MRLLTTSNLELVEFRPHEIPPYAILSHTWEKHEVLLQDMVNQSAQKKPSFAKVRSAVHQARKGGLGYVWVDNCCIDKSSSAELSESLNSMYAWYQNAAICYAYLSDVTADIDVTDSDSEFARSLWFTRGFTLQELLAPAQVVFFSRDWIAIGSKIELQESLSTITGISVQYLCHQEPIFSACIAERMSWAAKRQTSRPEDVAYCLLGIFNVNMPHFFMVREKRRHSFVCKKKSCDSRTTIQSLPGERTHRLTPFTASSPQHLDDLPYHRIFSLMKTGRCCLPTQ